MWQDLSFDLRSFDPDSFGPSWGLTWEAAQDEEVLHGGGGGYLPKPTRKKQPIRNTQEKDLMEMLTIIMTTGILCR